MAISELLRLIVCAMLILNERRRYLGNGFGGFLDILQLLYQNSVVVNCPLTRGDDDKGGKMMSKPWLCSQERFALYPGGD